MNINAFKILRLQNTDFSFLKQTDNPIYQFIVPTMPRSIPRRIITVYVNGSYFNY